MMFPYNIAVIDHHAQRYPTVGDYWRDSEGALQVRISAMSDPRYEFLVLIHEMIEQKLCEVRGITIGQIDAFDLSYEGDDPGSAPDAPYRKEHEFSTAIEMLIAQQLGVDWVKYDSEVRAL